MDWLKAALGAAAGIGILWLADRLMNPVPLAAGTVWLGGFIGLWLSRPSPWMGALIGGFLGLAAGTATHAYWHLSGQSPLPPGGIPFHVAIEAAIGLLIGNLALTCALLLELLPRR